MKTLLPMSVFLLAISTGIALAQAGAGTMGATNSSNQSPSAATEPSNQSTTTNANAVDDQTLHREIHEQLATNPDLQGVQVEVNKGVVKLTGSVANKDDKKQAAKLVKSVAGVKKVKDNLTVATNGNGAAASSSMGSQSGNNSTTGANNGGSGEPGSPGSMTENPPSAQNPNNAPNSNVPHNNFMDDQADGQNGAGANQNAGGSSSQASGAPPNATDNNPSAEDGGRVPQSNGSSSAAGQSSTTGAAESSDQVKNEIQTAFHNEPTLTSSNISVDVTDSKVTLSGTAPSEKDRDEARRIAQSFAGNRSLVDNVKVEGMGSGASTPDASANPNANPGSNTGMQNGTSANNPEQPNTPKQ